MTNIAHVRGRRCGRPQPDFPLRNLGRPSGAAAGYDPASQRSEGGDVVRVMPVVGVGAAADAGAAGRVASRRSIRVAIA